MVKIGDKSLDVIIVEEFANNNDWSDLDLIQMLIAFKTNSVREFDDIWSEIKEKNTISDQYSSSDIANKFRELLLTHLYLTRVLNSDCKWLPFSQGFEDFIKDSKPRYLLELISEGPIGDIDWNGNNHRSVSMSSSLDSGNSQLTFNVSAKSFLPRDQQSASLRSDESVEAPQSVNLVSEDANETSQSVLSQHVDTDPLKELEADPVEELEADPAIKTTGPLAVDSVNSVDLNCSSETVLDGLEQIEVPDVQPEKIETSSTISDEFAERKVRAPKSMSLFSDEQTPPSDQVINPVQEPDWKHDARLENLKESERVVLIKQIKSHEVVFAEDEFDLAWDSIAVEMKTHHGHLNWTPPLISDILDDLMDEYKSALDLGQLDTESLQLMNELDLSPFCHPNFVRDVEQLRNKIKQSHGVAPQVKKQINNWIKPITNKTNPIPTKKDFLNSWKPKNDIDEFATETMLEVLKENSIKLNDMALTHQIWDRAFLSSIGQDLIISNAEGPEELRKWFEDVYEDYLDLLNLVDCDLDLARRKWSLFNLVHRTRWGQLISDRHAKQLAKPASDWD